MSILAVVALSSVAALLLVWTVRRSIGARYRRQRKVLDDMLFVLNWSVNVTVEVISRGELERLAERFRAAASWDIDDAWIARAMAVTYQKPMSAYDVDYWRSIATDASFSTKVEMLERANRPVDEQRVQAYAALMEAGEFAPRHPRARWHYDAVRAFGGSGGRGADDVVDPAAPPEDEA